MIEEHISVSDEIKNLKDEVKMYLDLYRDCQRENSNLREKIEKYEKALKEIRNFPFHILCEGAEHEIACCNIAKAALEHWLNEN